MKIHFIGIGGIGISGLAKQAVAVCGADVSSAKQAVAVCGADVSIQSISKAGQ